MKAIDIVLFPPKEIMDQAIEMNRKILETGNNKIVLSEEKCIPHITIAMGCVKDEDIEKLDGILSDIASASKPIALSVVPSKSGKAWLKLEKTRELELLHEIVMIRASNLFSHNVDMGMMYNENNEKISDMTINYIGKFLTKYSFENYTPHITITSGEMDMEVNAMNFTSREMAICHLGDYCTCRKVLSSHKLIG